MVFYRLLTNLIYALLLVRRQWVHLMHPEADNGRLSPPPVRTGSAPLIWLHGASNGEVTAARGLIETLLARLPGVEILVTTNTRTAREMVAGWGLARTQARLAPFDQIGLVRAFLDRQRPLALVMIENELWPNRMCECARRGLPILVIGGRMSPRSRRLWHRLPRLIAPLMAAIRWLAPQDDLSRRAFVALGLSPDRLGPNLVLKAAVSARQPQTALPYARANTLLAASTHEGEEAVVLDAFAALLPQHPGLRLILAPRHPQRRDQIAALIRDRALSHSLRSRGQDPDATTQVYLADTMGEMAIWYPAAGLCFVGGSLAPRGGHTPFEPVAHGAVILHGPSLQNFADAYRALDRSGGALCVQGADSLAHALAALIGDADAQAAIAAQARTALAPFRAHADIDVFFTALAALTGLTPTAD